MASSSTVTTSATRSRTCGQVSSPSTVERRPSAAVRATCSRGQRCRSPACQLAAASPARAGSAPITRTPEPAERGGDPADQPAAADRHHDLLHARAVGEDLGAHGALTGDDVGVVVGRDQRPAGLGDRGVGGRLALVGGHAHQPGAQRGHGLDLGLDRVVRHDHGARDAEAPRDPGQRAPVVARGVGDQAGRPALGREAARGVEGAAQLERADRLEVLALHREAGRELLDRRPHRDALEHRGGRGDVGRTEQRHPCRRRIAARPGGSPVSGGIESGSTAAGPGTCCSPSAATHSGVSADAAATAERLSRASATVPSSW